MYYWYLIYFPAVNNFKCNRQHWNYIHWKGGMINYSEVQQVHFCMSDDSTTNSSALKWNWLNNTPKCIEFKFYSTWYTVSIPLFVKTKCCIHAAVGNIVCFLCLLSFCILIWPWCNVHAFCCVGFRKNLVPGNRKTIEFLKK